MYNKCYFVFALLACANLGQFSKLMAMTSGGDHGQIHTVSWDDFKYRCGDAKDKPFNEQGRPRAHSLQCTNIEREFVPGDPGVLTWIRAGTSSRRSCSDKFDVAAMSKDYVRVGRPRVRAPACATKKSSGRFRLRKP